MSRCNDVMKECSTRIRCMLFLLEYATPVFLVQDIVPGSQVGCSVNVGIYQVWQKCGENGLRSLQPNIHISPHLIFTARKGIVCMVPRPNPRVRVRANELPFRSAWPRNFIH